MRGIALLILSFSPEYLIDYWMAFFMRYTSGLEYAPLGMRVDVIKKGGNEP